MFLLHPQSAQLRENISVTKNDQCKKRLLPQIYCTYVRISHQQNTEVEMEMQNHISGELALHLINHVFYRAKKNIKLDKVVTFFCPKE